MINWEILNFFGLIPELLDFSNDKNFDLNKSKNTPIKSSFLGRLLGGNINNIDKKKWTKIVGFSALTIFLYFSFFSGSKHIFIKSISHDSTNKTIKLTAINNTEYQIDGQNFQNYTSSEKINHSDNAYKIYTKTKDKQSDISFNITFTQITNSGILASTLSDKFGFDNGQTITLSEQTTNTDQCSNQNNCLGSILKFAILNQTNQNQYSFSNIFYSYVPTILYLISFVFLIKYIMKSNGLYGKNSIFSMGNSVSGIGKSDLLFDDVGGLSEEKEELKEIVDFLKNSKKYKAFGSRIPRGIIFNGPPGNGKTLLAKALSGEADVAFLQCSGASFDDMFVGSGAKRVRELFEKAKSLAPCIVFIDEIDALAKKRDSKLYTGGGSGDQTINQLLTEMDGFNTQDGIIVIGATNRINSLDEAILRPGRFDRNIMINFPNMKDRIDILKKHSENKNISSSISIENIARKTSGFSGAQLENILNEASVLAIRNKKIVITKEEISEAIDRIIAGPAKKSQKLREEERIKIAYHEAGHAIAGLYCKDGESVEKVTIIPRGKAAGYMLTAPEKEDIYIYTKKRFLSTIITTLAGRAAEEIFFGSDLITSGAANDLYKVTQLTTKMVSQLGMSNIVGLVQYESSENDDNPYKNSYSEHTSQLIDQEIKEIINVQYEKAKEIINNNKEELLLIVEALLILETIDKEDIDYIHKNKQLPDLVIKLKEKINTDDRNPKI